MSFKPGNKHHCLTTNTVFCIWQMGTRQKITISAKFLLTSIFKKFLTKKLMLVDEPTEGLQANFQAKESLAFGRSFILLQWQ